MTKKSFLLLSLMLIPILLVAIFSFKSKVVIEAFELDKTEYVFSEIGEMFQPVAEIYPTDATEREVVWHSSDYSVATVSEDGTITAVGDGTATITVYSKMSSATASCEVTVKTYVPVTGLSLAEHEHEFTYFGEAIELIPQVYPENATEKGIRWSSSDPNVAVVDSNGIVISVANGTSVITATSEDGGFSDSFVCTVYVDTNIPMVDVNFDITEYTFTTFDEIINIQPVWEPANTTERGLTWVISDKSVISVDTVTGAVTPLKNGTATIYAVTDNKQKQAICQITVDVPIPAENIVLTEKEHKFEAKNQTFDISYIIYPANATERTATYSSSSNSVISVDSNGRVTALSNGEATVRVTVSDTVYTEFTAIVEIPDKVAVAGVVFTEKSFTFAEIGDSISLPYTVSPANATNKAVTFTSSDPNSVSVDANGKITAKADGSSVITVTTADGGFTDHFLATVSVKKEEIKVDEMSSEITQPESGTESKTDDIKYTVGSSSDNLVGTWVTTVYNGDFPSKPGLSAEKLRSEIDTIVNTAYDSGITAIFLQVRPASDALYKSNIFPSSDVVVAKQGDELPLDCLEYFISAAHAKGIELHAWINPYRVLLKGETTADLAATNPAKIHPEWTVKHSDGLTYYNPGIPEVRQLVVNGVLEIINNYNVDGIHFDDYFYPYDNASTFADDKEYALYKTGNQTKREWRLENNNKLIESVYRAIKSTKSEVSFGVSPCGVWALKTNNPLGTDIKSSSEAYYQIYADTRAWVLNEWLDYICPQVYWEIGHSTAPFKPIVDWWDDLVSTTNVKLYIGIAAYKGETTAAYKVTSEIANELAYLKTKKNVNGAVIYSYGNIKKNTAGVRDTVKTYSKTITNKGALVAASDTLVLAYSTLKVEDTTKRTFIIGVSDPNYSLTVNGEEVTTRSAKGYFTWMVDVPNYGDNHYTIEHKGETVDYIIKRSYPYEEPTTMSSFGFVSGSCAPKYDYANVSGTEKTFCCTATAGAKVYVKLGEYTIELKSTVKDSTDGTFKRAWYEGTFTLPDVEGNVSLGSPVFYIEKEGYETVKYEGKNTVEVINDPKSYVVSFVKDTAWLIPDPDVTGEEYRFATIGATDYVVSKYDNNTKLGSGYYTPNENIQKLDTTLSYANIGKISVSQSSDGKYTNLNIPTDGKPLSTVWTEDDKLTVTLYNLSSIPSEFTMPDNPLFTDSVTVSKVDNTTVKIVLKYKKSLYFFGYKSYFEEGKLVIAFKNPVSLYNNETYPLNGIKISVDPGHSLNGGALGPWGTLHDTEADWNYELSKLVEERLIKLGATVRLSHHRELKDDLDPLIVEFRAWEPDLNISIHFNYVGETSNPINLSGCVTYYSYTNSKLFAKTMLESFTGYTGLKKNDYKIGYYKVSLFQDFPSILFETAYMSNYNDVEWFMEDENMEKAADAIVEGIIQYFKLQS